MSCSGTNWKTICASEYETRARLTEAYSCRKVGDATVIREAGGMR